MTDLKPCPLCGSHEIGRTYPGGDYTKATAVVCGVCGCRGPFEDNDEDAIAAWNRRPSPPVRVDGVELDQLRKWAEAWPHYACNDEIVAAILSALNTRSPDQFAENAKCLVRSPSASPASDAGSAMSSEGGEIARSIRAELGRPFSILRGDVARAIASPDDPSAREFMQADRVIALLAQGAEP